MTTWVASAVAPDRVHLVDVDGGDSPLLVTGTLGAVAELIRRAVAGMPVAVESTGLGLPLTQELMVRGAKVVTFRMTDARSG